MPRPFLVLLVTLVSAAATLPSEALNVRGQLLKFQIVGGKTPAVWWNAPILPLANKGGI
jgi:hypothetical protein